MKLRALVGLVTVAALVGCSSTPEELDKSTSAARTTKKYSENYQEVYRRLVRTARLCSGGPAGKRTAFQLATDLYSDLGYGELSLSLYNYGTHNFYWKAKIEKDGTGSKLTVVSGNTLAQNSQLNSIVRWADGGEGCI